MSFIHWSVLGFAQSGQLNLGTSTKEVIVPRSYPGEFRRKVLDLVEAGRPVAEIAEQLGVRVPLSPSSVAFTMTVYQHVMPGLQAQAASAKLEVAAD